MWTDAITFLTSTLSIWVKSQLWTESVNYHLSSVQCLSQICNSAIPSTMYLPFHSKQTPSSSFFMLYYSSIHLFTCHTHTRTSGIRIGSRTTTTDATIANDQLNKRTISGKDKASRTSTSRKGRVTF